MRERLAQALTGERPEAPAEAAERTAFLAAADANGVVGLLAHLGPDFERVAQAHRAKSIRALRFTVRASRVLEEARIAHAVLKGATSAARWSEPSARQQSDLDVLVHRDDLRKASRAMVDSGLASHEFLAGEEMHNAALQPKEASGLLIEIHHALNSSHEVKIDIAALLSRRIRVQTAQGPIWGLSLEDDAVFLALHASTHALHRLAWLVDLWRLGPAGVDWVEAARRARRGNVAIPVELAWRQTRELLAAPIPEAAFETLGVGLSQRLRYESLFRLTHATRGRAQQFFERSFRMALVPLWNVPGVLAHKLRAREEEAEAYASLSPREKGRTEPDPGAG